MSPCLRWVQILYSERPHVVLNASKAVWPVEATPPNMLKFNVTDTSPLMLLDDRNIKHQSGIKPFCFFRCPYNFLLNIALLNNIWLQGDESGQLPVLDSTFEGIPQK